MKRKKKKRPKLQRQPEYVYKFYSGDKLRKLLWNLPKELDFDGGWVLIYALEDPRDKTIRYVGKTIYRAGRQEDHENAAWQNNVELKRWQDELKKAGLKPNMLTLGKAWGNKWQQAEMTWIRWFERDQRCDLYNIEAGGNTREGLRGRRYRLQKYEQEHYRLEEKKKRIALIEEGKLTKFRWNLRTRGPLFDPPPLRQSQPKPLPSREELANAARERLRRGFLY